MWSASHTTQEQARPWDSLKFSLSLHLHCHSLLLPGSGSSISFPDKHSWLHPSFPCFSPAPCHSSSHIIAAHSCKLFFLKSGSKDLPPHQHLWDFNFHRKSRLLSAAFKIFQDQAPTNLFSFLSFCCFIRPHSRVKANSFLPRPTGTSYLI